MAKPAKSQWDFGELFPVEATRKVLTVAELTGNIKRLLEKQVGEVWVTGEVTNFRSQSSGHLYFTLKDAESQVSCVLFRNEARESRDLLQDGRKVILQGDLTVYEPRGQYQLRVTAVELQGVGALQAAFERLKQKLNAEGLFASERKRPLPRYPQRIGIVTSPTGAAIHDVLHVVQRRNPGLEIILAPARVQGQGAAEEIAEAIRLLNEFNERQFNTSNGEEVRSLTPALSPDGGEGKGIANFAMAGGNSAFRMGTVRKDHSALDLILITRGGGSLEDLWAFNEEVVARAIFESKLPIVSAVGHEIDFTISDFVADVRAATPSAAAEIITDGVYSSFQFVSAAGERLRQLTRQQLEFKEDEFAQLRLRLMRAHPQSRVNDLLQRLDDLQGSMTRCVRHGTRTQQIHWRNLWERLMRVRPRSVLENRRELLRLEERRLRELTRAQLRDKQSRLATTNARLKLLGPEQVLARGYSITMRAESGEIIRAADQVKAGDKLKTRLKSGEIRSVVEK